jgi:hypothetical protein
MPLLDAQVVRLRNIEPAPGAGYTVITDAAGKQYYVVAVNGAINVQLTPIAYVPAATGNPSGDYNKVVTDPNGDVWIIDSAGDALKTGSSSGGGGGSVTEIRDSLNSSGLIVYVRRLGGTVSSISSSGAGTYTVTIASGSIVLGIDVVGDNTDVDGSGALNLIVNNNLNSRPLYFSTTFLNRGTNQIIDHFAAGLTPGVTASTNTITYAIPNVNGFGASGYRLILR